MKRSKMLFIMKKCLEITRGDDDSGIVRLMLSVMEEEGMKPPHVTIPGKWQSPGDNCIWEEEDEEKRSDCQIK